MFSSDRKVSQTSFSSLVATLMKMADAKMSCTQKIVLMEAHRLLKFNELTVTALADQVSRRSAVPYSTVKWNLRSLREMGLLEGGGLHSKGKNARLTHEAQMLAEYFDNNQ